MYIKNTLRPINQCYDRKENSLLFYKEYVARDTKRTASIFKCRKNKMRSIGILRIIIFLILLSGCVPSLQPLFTEIDLVFNPALLGHWIDKNGKVECTFKKSGEKQYELIAKRKNLPEDYYSVHLVKLQDFYFLDIYPKNKSEYCKSIFFGIYYILAHNIAKITIDKDVLRINMFNPAVLENMIKNKKINISHAYYGENILLTASTAELQDFVLKYANDKGLFSCSSEFKRKTKIIQK